MAEPKLSHVHEDTEGANTVVGKYIRRARYIFGQGFVFEIADPITCIAVVALLAAVITLANQIVVQVCAAGALVVFVAIQKLEIPERAKTFNQAIQAAFKARGIEYMRKWPESTPAIELILDAIDNTTRGGPRIVRGPRLDPQAVRRFLAEHPELEGHMRTFLTGAGLMKGSVRSVFPD